MATLANLIKNIDPPAPDSVVLATENTTADSIKFGIGQGGKMGYIPPGANTVTPFQSDVQADSVVLATENETADSIKFGFDANGKLGYIAPGADTVTPFKSQADIDSAHQEGLESARIDLIATVIVGGNGAHGNYLGKVQTVTFVHNYSQVIIVMAHSDTDDSGDNFMKVYSSNKGWTNDNAAPGSSYWTNTTDEWNYFKPTLSGVATYAGLAKTNTTKYASTPNDKDKDIYRTLNNLFTMSCAAYKVGINSGDKAYIYSTHGSTCYVFGVRTD